MCHGHIFHPALGVLGPIGFLLCLTRSVRQSLPVHWRRRLSCCCWQASSKTGKQPLDTSDTGAGTALRPGWIEGCLLIVYLEELANTDQIGLVLCFKGGSLCD